MDLDEYQEAARLNQDEKVLLVAPPGSGKTTVLLAKIKFLMTDLNFSPKEILIFFVGCRVLCKFEHPLSQAIKIYARANSTNLHSH